MSGKELVEEEIRRSTQQIWDTIDTDKDEEITKEEFIANALNNEFITGLFSNIWLSLPKSDNLWNYFNL